MNCGCRSDELESQTEPVVRRGRRIVTTSKIKTGLGMETPSEKCGE